MQAALEPIGNIPASLAMSPEQHTLNTFGVMTTPPRVFPLPNVRADGQDTLLGYECIAALWYTPAGKRHTLTPCPELMEAALCHDQIGISMS